jgi:polyhydroxyalkanoate synthesis regulator phasin
MKKNTFIECPEKIKDMLLEESKDISNALLKMVEGMTLEAKFKYLKTQLPRQIQIQMVKAWHNEHNQRARLNDIISDLENKVKDLENSLQRQVK